MKLPIFLFIAGYASAAAGPVCGQDDSKCKETHRCDWKGGADCGINIETMEACGWWSKADGWGGGFKPDHSSYSKFEYDLATAQECNIHDFECHC